MLNHWTISCFYFPEFSYMSSCCTLDFFFFEVISCISSSVVSLFLLHKYKSFGTQTASTRKIVTRLCYSPSGGQSATTGGGEPRGRRPPERGGHPRRHAAGEDPKRPGWHCPVSAAHPQRRTQPDFACRILTCSKRPRFKYYWLYL